MHLYTLIRVIVVQYHNNDKSKTSADLVEKQCSPKVAVRVT